MEWMCAYSLTLGPTSASWQSEPGKKFGKPPKLPATERAATAIVELLFKFESAITINSEQRQAQFYVVDKSLHLAEIDIIDAFG